jgi:flagellar biosynthesis chaperone FliJ
LDDDHTTNKEEMMKTLDEHTRKLRMLIQERNVVESAIDRALKASLADFPDQRAQTRIKYWVEWLKDNNLYESVRKFTVVEE